jgi:hypothetical protein
MSTAITCIAVWTPKAGKEDALREQTIKNIAFDRADPGVVRADAYVGAGMIIKYHITFTNAAALLANFTSGESLIEETLAISDISGAEMYGQAEELKQVEEILAQFGGVAYTSL